MRLSQNHYLLDRLEILKTHRRNPQKSVTNTLRFQRKVLGRLQPPTINCSVAALRFFFTITLDRPDLSRRLVLARYPRKLPVVLSVEEVGRLLEATPGIKYKTIFGTAYCAGRPGSHRKGRLRRRQPNKSNRDGTIDTG